MLLTLFFLLVNLVVFAYFVKRKWYLGAAGQFLLTTVSSFFLLMLSNAPLFSEIVCEIVGKPLFDVIMDVITAPYWHAVSLSFIAVFPLLIGECVAIALLSSIHAVRAIVRRTIIRAVQPKRAANPAPVLPAWQYIPKPQARILYCTMLC